MYGSYGSEDMLMGSGECELRRQEVLVESRAIAKRYYVEKSVALSDATGNKVWRWWIDAGWGEGRWLKDAALRRRLRACFVQATRQPERPGDDRGTRLCQVPTENIRDPDVRVISSLSHKLQAIC